MCERSVTKCVMAGLGPRGSGSGVSVWLGLPYGGEEEQQEEEEVRKEPEVAYSGAKEVTICAVART